MTTLIIIGWTAGIYVAGMLVSLVMSAHGRWHEANHNEPWWVPGFRFDLTDSEDSRMMMLWPVLVLFVVGSGIYELLVFLRYKLLGVLRTAVRTSRMWK